MQHLGAIIRELGDLTIANFRKGFCRGHQAWVGGHDAIHVCPDPDIVRRQDRADDPCRVVAASASEGGDHALGRRAHEAGCDDHQTLLQKRVQASACLFGCRLEIGVGILEVGIGDNELTCFNGLHANSRAFHDRAQQPDAHSLAQ